jgi:hypothetical protein
MRLARPDFRPRQRYADVVKIVMRYPQLMRTFRQGRKVGCDPAQQRVKFKLCRSQQFALRN